jgi:hypothetical protein
VGEAVYLPVRIVFLCVICVIGCGVSSLRR